MGNGRYCAQAETGTNFTFKQVRNIFSKAPCIITNIGSKKGHNYNTMGLCYLIEWRDITVSTDEDLQDKSSFLKRQDTGQCVEYMLKKICLKLCLVHKRPASWRRAQTALRGEGDLLYQIFLLQVLCLHQGIQHIYNFLKKLWETSWLSNG